MDPTTLSGDSRITSTGSGWTASLDGGLTEPIYTPRTGEVAGVARVIPVSSTTPATYTVNQYVTAPANCACKRVSVVASWTDRGIARTRWTSTVITPAYRSWSLNRTTVGTPLTGTRGTEFAIGVTLINTSVPASGGSNPTFSVSVWAPTDWGTVTWYVDTNGDGIREANETTVATTSGGNATVSVPLGGSVQLLADFTPPTTATSRTSVTVSAVPLNVPASGGQTLPVPVVLS
jgi:hypothetical protein